MTHKALTNECEALALKVEQQPDPGGANPKTETSISGTLAENNTTQKPP